MTLSLLKLSIFYVCVYKSVFIKLKMAQRKALYICLDRDVVQLSFL